MNPENADSVELRRDEDLSSTLGLCPSHRHQSIEAVLRCGGQQSAVLAGDEVGGGAAGSFVRAKILDADGVEKENATMGTAPSSAEPTRNGRVLLLAGFSAGILLGVVIGWFLGNRLPLTPAQRQEISDYRAIKAALNVPDGKIADLVTNLPAYMSSVRRNDELAAFVALGALRELEAHRENDAKEGLAKMVGIYYNTWITNGADPDVIDTIEQFADKCPLLDASLETNIPTPNLAPK